MHINRLLSLLFLLVVLPVFCFSQWNTSNNGSNSRRAVTHFSSSGNTSLYAALADPDYTLKVNEITASSDGGNNWTVRQVTIDGEYQVNAVTAPDALHVWVVMEADTGGGCIAYSADAGFSWTMQDSAIFISRPVWIHFWNDTAGLAVGDPVDNRFEMFTTVNGGMDWEKVPSSDIPVSIEDEFALTNSFFVKGDTVFFAGSTYGKIFTSTDKGNTWSYLPFPLNDIKKVICLDSSALLAGTPGLADTKWDFYITYDWGQHWSAITSEGPAYTSDVCHVPGTDSTLVSAGLGLSYSNDMGRTWKNFTGPTSFPSPYYHVISFNDLTHGWAGGVNPEPGQGGIAVYAGPAMSTMERESMEITAIIYPNPCDDVCHLQLVNSFPGVITYSIYDFSGRAVQGGIMTVTAGVVYSDLDVSMLKPGFYMLQLAGKELSIQKELIVR